MRPIPADSLGHAHGLLRAIDKRGRLRTDEFVTEFSLDELFPPDLENALGRMRHFISFARAAGLVKEDRGVVELTEVGKRYIRSGDPDAPFSIGDQQAEWLRRQLREKHMTDSIFHGLAIGLSLLASTPPGTRVATMDFGRSMAYLGRAGWDNENTLQIQGERHLALLRDMEMIDAEDRLTPTGDLVRGELTLPVHMSLPDIAAQLNPGGADAVAAAAEAEYAVEEAPPPPPEPAAEPVVAEAPEPEPEDDDDNGYHTVVGSIGSVAPPREPEEPARPPIVPRAASTDYGDDDDAPELTSGDPLAAEPDVVYPPPVDAPTVITPGATASTPPPVEETAPPHVAPGDPLAGAAPEVPASQAPPVSSAPPEVAAPPVSSAPPEVAAPPVSSAPPEVAAPPVSSVPPEVAAPPVSSAPPEVAAPPVSSAPPEVAAPPVSSAPPEVAAPPVSSAPPETAPADDFAPPAVVAGDPLAAAPSPPPPEVVAPPVSSAPPEQAAPVVAESPVSSAPPVGAPDQAAPAAAEPPVSSAPPEQAAPAAGESPVASVPPVAVPPVSSAPPVAAPEQAAPVAAEPSVSPAPPVAAPEQAAPVAAEPSVSSAPPVAAPEQAAPVAAEPSVSLAPPVAAPEQAAPVSSAPPVAAPGQAAPAVGEPPVSSAPPVAAPEQAAPTVAPEPAPAVSQGPPVVPVAGPTPTTPRRETPPPAGVFVEAWAIRAAAEEAGLRLADDTYANVAAALNAGKHLVLTGAPGSGKTTLALAITRAAAQAGHAHGATVITGAPSQALLTDAAPRGRWVIADELDQANPDEALKPLSTLLAGVPVTLDGEEAGPARGWRVVATWNGSPPRGANVLRRFAAIDVARPPADTLKALVAQSDPRAQEAVDTLLALGAPLGAGVLIEAANHIRTRQASVPTDAATLADEAVAAYISPLLEL